MPPRSYQANRDHEDQLRQVAPLVLLAAMAAGQEPFTPDDDMAKLRADLTNFDLTLPRP